MSDPEPAMTDEEIAWAKENWAKFEAANPEVAAQLLEPVDRSTLVRRPAAEAGCPVT